MQGASIGAWKVDCDNGELESLAQDLLAALKATGADADEVWEKARNAYETCNKSNNCQWPSPPPFAHLSFVCGWADGNGDKALNLAQARARAQQFRRFTLRPAGLAGEGYCPKDKMRPAQVPGRLPDTQDKNVSRSLLARRAYGRFARQGFHAGEAGKEWGKKFFVNNFKEMVGNEPAGLPLSVRSKIAVFYADGNNFSKLAGDSIDKRRKFSTELRKLQQDLLKKHS